jgi:hypothetical protein
MIMIPLCPIRSPSNAISLGMLCATHVKIICECKM